ncbi:nuclease [Paraliobacillus quinghaiensis]|uniref:Nuclease n=1 Tax=Paraliobacillus quinghaiensis TaxID=470815 RepID=A0A917WVP3_9BACI|nr:nuclease-related domain-containing protein [Paraliobacillus quinghaiensis]GGM32706.1 nuclease [Paraliobacillus quinghaiensis]
MIGKPLTVSSRLNAYEALLRRLPSHHPTYTTIEKAYTLPLAGYRGEKEVYYRLKNLSDNFIIFHDLRLPHQDSFFQIDFLVLSKSCIFVIEVKNMRGTLFFDTHFKQLIRTVEEKEEGFRNPLAQVQEHKWKLSEWFSKVLNISSVPIESFVAIANSSSVLKTNAADLEIYQRVVHAEYLIDHLNDWNTYYLEKNFGFLDVDQITKELLDADTPFQPDLLKRYGIKAGELRNGVVCPHCNAASMKRTHGKWLCWQCNKYSKGGAEQAIGDYLQLIASSISNQECRSYLGIESPQLAKRILHSADVVGDGATKNRRYRVFDRIN